MTKRDRVFRSILLTGLAVPFLLAGCSTMKGKDVVDPKVANQTKDRNKTNQKTNRPEEILAMLSENPPKTIDNAINIGAYMISGYSEKLNRADRKRRFFNIGALIAQTYTAIGAGLQVHPDNLVVSSALTSAIPLAEPQFQTDGDPETLGGAMTKTHCVMAAGRRGLSVQATEAHATLKLAQRLGVDDEAVKVALTNYDRLPGRMSQGYMQAYINYSVARTPPLLSKEKLETIATEQGLVADGGGVAPLRGGGDGKKKHGITKEEAIEAAGFLNGISSAVEEDIKKCL